MSQGNLAYEAEGSPEIGLTGCGGADFYLWKRLSQVIRIAMDMSEVYCCSISVV